MIAAALVLSFLSACFFAQANGAANDAERAPWLIVGGCCLAAAVVVVAVWAVLL